MRENLRMIKAASGLVKQILTFSHKEELERHPVPVYFAGPGSGPVPAGHAPGLD